jgi:hypothetical protein
MRMIRRENGRTPRWGKTDNEPRTESRGPPLSPAKVPRSLRPDLTRAFGRGAAANM